MKTLPSLIDAFSKHFTYDASKEQRRVGMEGEFPVVYRNGQAVDYAVICRMFGYLEQQGFSLEFDPKTGELSSAKRPAQHVVDSTSYNMDVISTDTGFSIIEISPAPVSDLFVLQQVFSDLMQLLVDYFDTQDVMILGYGVQPVTPPGSQMMAPKSRYLLFKQWSANHLIPASQGYDCDLLTISASNQTHIDVHASEAITATNVINGLAGLQIILHANSPFWQGKTDPECKAVREHFWDHCFPSRVEQVGIPDKFTDMEDYVQQLCAFKMQAVERDGETISVSMPDSFLDFLNAESVSGVDTQEVQCVIQPQQEDLYHQAGYAWYNGRLAPRYGTIEARVYCQQPPGETLCSHALTLGLIENLSGATQLLNRVPWETWQQLRSGALQQGFNTTLGQHSVIDLLEEMLAVASAGLQQRGLQEEALLAPLYQRLAVQQSPADQALKQLQEKGLACMLDAVSFKRDQFSQGAITC